MPSFRYIPKKVSEVNPSDLKVVLVGNVISTAENSIVLGDETGKIEISSDRMMGKNKLIRVFCSVVEEKLKADVVQDMEGLDLDLFKKINELYSKAGV